MVVYFSVIIYNKGENELALSTIRNVVACIDSVSRNAAIGYASMIYLKAGIADTAYIYARELVERNLYNRKLGYRVILSPDLKDRLHIDTLYRYLTPYRDILENSLNQNESQQALFQETLYNYQIHQREREKAEEENEMLWWLLISIITLSSTIVIITIYRKYRKQGSMVKSYLAIDRLKRLNISLSVKDDKEDNNLLNLTDVQIAEDRCKSKENEPDLIVVDKVMTSLGERIRKELLELLKDCSERHEISADLLNSHVYSDIRHYLKKGKAISEMNAIWGAMEDEVLASSPHFKSRLNLLVGEKLKTIDYNMILLIRYGLNPTEVSALMGKSKAAISYRRARLSERAFMQKLDPKNLDFLIRCI